MPDVKISLMTGNKAIDYVILIISGIACVGVLGVYVYTDVIFQRPLPDDLIEKAKLMKDAKKVIFTEAYKLDKLTINLKSKTKRLRFLDIEVHFIPFKSKYNDLFDQHKSEISDSIINLAGEMVPEELNSVSGKLLLENRIKVKINALLGGDVVKEVLFSKFIVQ